MMPRCEERHSLPKAAFAVSAATPRKIPAFAIEWPTSAARFFGGEWGN